MDGKDRKCKSCRKTKPLTDEYYKKSNTYSKKTGAVSTYYRNVCTECHNKAQALKRQQNIALGLVGVNWHEKRATDAGYENEEAMLRDFSARSHDGLTQCDMLKEIGSKYCVATLRTRFKMYGINNFAWSAEGKVWKHATDAGYDDPIEFVRDELTKKSQTQLALEIGTARSYIHKLKIEHALPEHKKPAPDTGIVIHASVGSELDLHGFTDADMKKCRLCRRQLTIDDLPTNFTGTDTNGVRRCRNGCGGTITDDSYRIGAGHDVNDEYFVLSGNY
ncbi:MAG: hypothetical protein GY800_09175 [Planctomycetes bacterium]|nr:hypothetical protein [Planctomycetota bacterium]